MANSNLGAARAAKQDEFYTQWADIEREMNAYLEYDPDVFRGKVILLPCDDPEWSNFTKFFALHFQDFGLKRLISTSYAPNSNAGAAVYQPPIFETEMPGYDPVKSMERGRLFELTSEDISGDGRIDIDDLRWEYLEGDGDFRSDEVTKLRDEADIVVTNPPFSLFREFLAWLVEGDIKFAMIGHQNALTYKEVFPLVRENKLWLGRGFVSGVGFFGSPYEDVAVAQDRREGFIRVSGVNWFTNIEHGRRHEPLVLMTMEDNLIYGSKRVREAAYPHYDNYDAIEVPETKGIPSDYAGVMGVPISFLDKYNPDQFEILGITKTWDDGAGLKKKIYPTQTQVSKNGTTSNVGKLNDGAAIPHDAPPENTTYYEVEGQIFTQPYARVLIRHRHPETKKD